MDAKIKDMLKKLPIDRSYNIKTKQSSISFQGRSRPDLNNENELFFEKKNHDMIRFNKNEVVWIEGSTDEDILVEKEIETYIIEKWRR